MAGNRSFKDYVADRFYNELFAAIKDYVEENGEDLDLRLYQVRNVGSIELSNIEVKFVFVNDLPEMKIEFEVVLEAEMEVREAEYHYDDSEYNKQWFMIIIDLHDRSVVASITDRHVTSDLAIRTLQKALDSQSAIKEELILHSDQGSQFTSKAFVEYCESAHVMQSMSKAGYPYDNAPMKRYFNTLKNDCIGLYAYESEEALYQAVEEFAYITYNHVRPTAIMDIKHHIRQGLRHSPTTWKQIFF